MRPLCAMNVAPTFKATLVFVAATFMAPETKRASIARDVSTPMSSHRIANPVSPELIRLGHVHAGITA